MTQHGAQEGSLYHAWSEVGEGTMLDAATSKGRGWLSRMAQDEMMLPRGMYKSSRDEGRSL